MMLMLFLSFAALPGLMFDPPLFIDDDVVDLVMMMMCLCVLSVVLILLLSSSSMMIPFADPTGYICLSFLPSFSVGDDEIELLVMM